MSDETAVAIVGMACRYPASDGVARFWATLRDGVDGITRFDRAELVAAGVDPDLARRPDYVPARGVLPGADRFDWSHFGYSAAEAAIIDPQQRVFLECAAQAMDDAAIDPARFPGWIGVFGGCDQVVLRIDDEAEAAAAVIGQDKDFLASRVAYKLGLRGPAVVVQTACSTSLAAVHTACQSLNGYECDAALAGGASVLLPQNSGYLFAEGGILSWDGYCRPFDADSGGTVASGGVGVVVLKRLADAVANGDRVIAVIAGSAINNDGGEKIGYTAPSIPGQRDVIRLAHEQAGADPRDIGYIEAHGTGTQVGDPVEVAALTAAFRESTDATGFCWLGAVKANIGHTGAAAGVAGLIKTALMLHHRELVPTPHLRRPNPRLDLAATPFRISTRRQPWTSAGPLLAGVSSFGIGGTNVHAVLAEAPDGRRPAQRPAARVFAVSAASPQALDQVRQELADRLAGADRPRLDDAALTLAAGRRRLAYRLAVVGGDPEQVARALRAPRQPVAAHTAPGVGFLFPGQGTLRPGAARAAHVLLPRFREVFDEIDAEVRRRFTVDLTPVVQAPVDLTPVVQAPVVQPLADPAWSTDTVHQQLGLFALGYALGRQFEAWRIVPEGMLGNSIGEYVAAALAGVWTLPDALTMVHERAQAMRAAPPGGMVSVAASPALAEAAIRDGGQEGDVVVAIAGPGQTVLSGAAGAVEALLASGRLSRWEPRRLDTARAFHSPLMRDAAQTVRTAAGQVPAQVPTRPFVSNVNGGWAGPDQVCDPGYWADHLIRPVRLDEGIETLLAGSCDVFVELGPGASMTGSLRRHRRWAADRAAVPLLPRQPQPEAGDRDQYNTAGGGEPSDEERLLQALGTLWEHGLDLPLEDLLAADEARRCTLPAHPLARTAVPVRGPARRARHVTGELAACSPPPGPGSGCARTEELGACSPPPKTGSGCARRLTPAAGTQPTGLTRAAWVQTEPGPARRYDAVLPLGARRGPAVDAVVAAWSAGTDAGAPPVPWERHRMVAAVEEFGRGAETQPAVLAVLPDRVDPSVLDDLDAVVAAAQRGGAAVLIVCHGLLDVLGGDGSAPGAALFAAWLDAEAARPRSTGEPGACSPPPKTGSGCARLEVTVLDLGVADPPAAAPLLIPGSSGYAWRGRRWWARTDQPVTAATGMPGRATTAVVSWGLPDGRRVAADLAAAGLRVGAYASGDAPSTPYPLAAEVPDALARTVARRATEAVPLSGRPDLRARLDTFCAGLIGRFALNSGGLEPGTAIGADELPARLDPTGLLPRFVDFMVSVLVQEGWLIRAGERLSVDPGLPDRVDHALAAGAGLDEVAGLRHLLDHCASAYPAVFAGERDRVSVLNPDGDPTMMREGLINNEVNPSGDVAICIEAVCRAVRAAQARRDGAALRILEVGAGQGELTWPLLTGWADRAGVSYHFTDISPLMVRKAQTRAAELGYDGMRCSVFDLTADPVGQGLAAGTFDLILAYNAVHVAPRVRDALGQLGRLLAPGGSVCFIETTGVARWAHVLWGLTPGWWDFGVDRTEAIHLDVATWTRLLAETGLTGVDAAAAGADADHTILLAAAPPAGAGIAGIAAELDRQAANGPCDEVLYLPAGPDPEPFDRWADLRRRPEVGKLRRAWVVTADRADDQDGPGWSVELRRGAVDPVAAGGSGEDPGVPASVRDQLRLRSPGQWRHVRVAGLGPAEVAALPAVLGRDDLPAVTRLAPPPQPAPAVHTGSEGVRAPDTATVPASGAAPVSGDEAALRGVLAGLWCEVLGVPDVSDADDFFALGGESLMAVHFMGRIRNRTGIPVTPAAFTRAGTFGDLVGLARAAAAGATGAGPDRPALDSGTVPELVVFSGSGTGTPLFLAAPAIGTTLSYRAFAERLDDDRPVFGIEAVVPAGTPVRDRVRLVAEQHVEVIRRVRPHGPYLLGGWSFGAVVAHDMARQLTALGEEVEAVVCIDGYVPSTAGRRMSTIPGYLSTGLWYQIQAQLRIGAVGDLVRVAPDVRRTFNASIRAIWHYRPVPVPCAAVVLKTGLGGTGLGGARARWLRDALAPMYRRGVEVRAVPGNHWSVLDERHAGQLAEEVRYGLSRGSGDRVAAAA